MFSFLKKKHVEMVAAPISGELITLDKVQDDVFSTKMMGDGFAIVPSEDADTVIAPIEGKIVTIPETKHAVGLQSKDGNIEVLLHIGLDTVNQQGQGFTAMVKAGETVGIGQPLIHFDTELLRNAGYDMTTMVIFTKNLANPVTLTEAPAAIMAGSKVLDVTAE